MTDETQAQPELTQTQDGAPLDPQFFSVVNEFLELTNRQSQQQGLKRISMASLYATARFNSHVYLANAGSTAAADRTKFLDYMSTLYRRMLNEHLDGLAPSAARRGRVGACRDYAAMAAEQAKSARTARSRKLLRRSGNVLGAEKRRGKALVPSSRGRPPRCDGSCAARGRGRLRSCGAGRAVLRRGGRAGHPAQFRTRARSRGGHGVRARHGAHVPPPTTAPVVSGLPQPRGDPRSERSHATRPRPASTACCSSTSTEESGDCARRSHRTGRADPSGLATTRRRACNGSSTTRWFLYS